MQLFFASDMRTHQRAAWIVGRVGELYPEAILPYADKMIENLRRPIHDAVIRNTMRVFSKMEIPEACEGNLYVLAFSYLLDPRQPVAIRVFSMTVAAQIALRHGTLIPELSEVVKMILPQGSPGIKSRGRNIVKLLDST